MCNIVTWETYIVSAQVGIRCEISVEETQYKAYADPVTHLVAVHPDRVEGLCYLSHVA